MALRVGLVGAGKVGRALLELLLPEPGFEVTVVADRDPEAPGAVLARERGLTVVPTPEAVFRHPVDVVIEVTRRPEVLQALRAACPPDVEVIGAATAHVIWDLVERRRLEAGRLRALIGAIHGLGREFSLRPVLDRIVREVVGLVGDAVAKLWLRGDGEALTLAASADQRAGMERGWEVFPPGRGLSWTVLTERRPLTVEDVRADPRTENRPWIERAGIVSYAGVPLQFGDEILGVLALFTRTRHAFTPSELELLSSFAASAAVAIRHAQALEDVTRNARAFESLAHITRSIIRSLEASQVYRAVVGGAAGVLGADSATLSVFDEATQTLSIGADFGFRYLEGREVKRWRLGEGLVGWVAQQLEPVFSPNFPEDSRVRNKAWARAEGLLAFGAVPLRVAGDRLVGVLTVFYRRAHAFTAEEVRLLTALGNQAAVAIENARLHGAAVRRGRELGALLRATRTVMAGLDLKVILEHIVQEAAQIAGTPHVTVRLVDREAQVLRVGAMAGSPVPAGLQVPLAEPTLSGTVATTGQPLFVPDVRSDPRFRADRSRDSAILTYLGLPITIRDEVLGVLTFNTTEPRQYSADELAYLGSFADQAAIAIENARLYADLQRALDAVRESQERQIQTERLRALGEMASGVAHQFNNMLAAILGRAQLLLGQARDPKLRQGLETIEKIAQDGAQRVRRIQEFTRVRRRQVADRVELNELVADALEFTRARWEREAQAAGHAYRVETDLGSLPAVLGEASELREVLVNVLLNAFDAMPNGGDLRVSTRGRDSRVEVRVTDSGAGMTEEIRRRAFEPFFTTKGPKSSGLGLAVAYGVVERHGGSVEIETEPGRGTTIVIALPVAPVPAPSDAARPAPVEGRSLRVLVVEDEDEVRDVLVEALTQWGHQVAAAADGAHGLRLASTPGFDLVLTDVSLPGQSGWAIADAVRAQRDAVPIVFVTGWGDQLDPARVAALGHAEVLSKPFRLDDLARLLDRLGAPASQ